MGYGGGRDGHNVNRRTHQGCWVFKAFDSPRQFHNGFSEKKTQEICKTFGRDSSCLNGSPFGGV